MFCLSTTKSIDMVVTPVSLEEMGGPQSTMAANGWKFMLLYGSVE